MGKLTEVRVETGAAPGLRLVVTQGSGGSAAAVEKHYTLPAVAAAVIHYCCFRARIPLPRHGTKSIEIVADGFQLIITTVAEVLRLHSDLPAVSQIEVGAPVATAPEPVVTIGDAALDDPTSIEPEEATTAAA